MVIKRFDKVKEIKEWDLAQVSVEFGKGVSV